MYPAYAKEEERKKKREKKEKKKKEKKQPPTHDLTQLWALVPAQF